MEDHYITNSLYITYTFSLQMAGRMYFLSLGVKDHGCFYRKVGRLLATKSKEFGR